MQPKDMDKLQEDIVGISILVNMVRQSLVKGADDAIDRIDEANYALKTIDTLFTRLLDECDRFTKQQSH
ncbi:hypothetical protein I2F27_11410 [Acinetobacter sp. B5B]|uniref:hypothetical protein n=1 Tax=Acinetobacter baretiae TaxID=2605383 RepID=UPI0018C348DA|nr:hypothetical protein [Acinetobacter baretiae]MBF7683926.1 hypothetical protein [Acinetobacter baretiae]